MNASTTEPLWYADARSAQNRTWWGMPEERREEIGAWMQTEGINPDNTAILAVYLIDAPCAVATHYVRDDDGRIMLTEDRQEARTYTVTYPLSSLPPGVSV